MHAGMETCFPPVSNHSQATWAQGHRSHLTQHKIMQRTDLPAVVSHPVPVTALQTRSHANTPHTAHSTK